MNRKVRLFGAAAMAAAACATAPRPSAESLKIRANPPAIIEGRVLDAEDRPVPSIGVRGIPRGKDIPWSPEAFTQTDGSFRLTVAAPAAYGFLLFLDGVAVITSSPEDPSLLGIAAEPGQVRTGVALRLLRAERERAMDAAGPGTPSSP